MLPITVAIAALTVGTGEPGRSLTTYESIAGYAPGSDIVQHNNIDLDQAAMETALAAADFPTATTHYAVGGNSLSKGSFRTLKGFSVSAQAKMYDGCPGCPYKHYSRFYQYYGDFDYADKWVSAALAGTSMSFTSGKHGPNDFSTLGSAARVEAVKKGTAYMNVWMYVIREFEDAIDDCATCTSDCNSFSLNSGSVHAWDEGVAFYTGSLEGTTPGGNSAGKLVYRLAEKRCTDFGTCGVAGTATSGTAKVNLDLFTLFNQGKALLDVGTCSSVRPVVDQIVSLMTVPLVQGSLRYAYKIGMVASDRSQKNAAEGAVFTASVLPLIHYCSPASATSISSNQKFGLFDAGTYPVFATVKSAFEATYPCLGITCSQVGALKGSDGTLLDAATAACTDFNPIAGYYPGSDVVQHNNIDLDQAAMETALAAADFPTATTHYAVGSNSLSKGSFRTLKGFSVSAQAKMYDGCPGCPYKHYSRFYQYYGDFDYADKWVSAALAGTSMSFTSGKHGPNDFSTLGSAARVEAVKKGTAYMNVWMYAIREFEDAIDDCATCTSDCNEFSVNSGSVHAWDEGVAFYTGSLEGTTPGGNSAGKLVYRLAEKRCADFGTCGVAGTATSGTAKVNLDLFTLFAEGARLLERGECSSVRPVVDQIVSLMTVPLVQGSLRYAYKIGMVASDRSQKNAAEGAVFTASVLPLIHYCSPASATSISSNQKFGLFDAGTYPVFATVKSAFEATYPCLGITCSQVGALQNSDGTMLDSTTAACTNYNSIAGYYPGSNVVQHNNIDLDQAAMETALAAADFPTATTHYAVGGNSLSKGSFRTLKGFSVSAQAKMYDGCPGCPYKHYSRFYQYYGDFDYADKWVSAALAGTSMSFTSGKHGPNDFSTLGSAARVEAVKKGTAYMNVWMYAIREFEDAIDDCATCTSDCNEFSVNSGSVHAWDEGVAFYTGSLEGTTPGGNSAGKLVYRLAEKRCADFGTCGVAGTATSGTAKVNLDLFTLFAEGARLLERGECSSVRPVVDQIVSLMTVPLVQGSLRYAYKIGMVASDRSQKNAAEGAVFTASVLPLIHYCSPASATSISSNQKFGLFDAGTYPVFATVKSAFEATYPCLGITCSQVGALKGSDATLLDAATAACTDFNPIAGYYPGSDVVQHNNIDLDQAAMETALAAADFPTATTHYAVGGNSLSKGSFRTLKGFSVSAQAKMYDGCPGCPYKHYSRFYQYYGDFDYADKWVSAALAGTSMSFTSGKHGPNDFSTLGSAARVEAVKKGTAYMNVWMYAIREFEDAIDDCATCTSDCNEFSVNSGSVHAWDEGVAFYTGSLEGTTPGGNSAGKLVYRLAEKRCADFGTCGVAGTATSGTAKANLDLFTLFAEGARLLERGECSSVRPVVDQIVSLMTVPLVQGSLRYAYKIGMVASDRSQKNAAEGAVFTASVLPLIDACNPTSAHTISSNQKFGLFDAGTYPDFAAVKLAFEETYGCLGITCAQAAPALYAESAPASASLSSMFDPRIEKTHTFVVTASGDVSSYTEAVKTSMKNSVASNLGVLPNQVALIIAPASVTVTVSIKAADSAQKVALENQVGLFLASTTSATTLLGGSTVVSVVSVVSDGVPGSRLTNATATFNITTTPKTSGSSSSDDLPSWGIAVIVVLAVLFATVIGMLCFMRQMEKKGKPIFTTVVKPQA